MEFYEFIWIFWLRLIFNYPQAKDIWLSWEVSLVVKIPPATAGDIRDLGSIPGFGRSPGGGHGNPLQYSCLENPMDRGAWQATVHGVPKSWTCLSDWAHTPGHPNNGFERLCTVWRPRHFRQQGRSDLLAPVWALTNFAISRGKKFFQSTWLRG